MNFKRSLVAVGACLTLSVAAAGPASAASWHGISGTTYSGCPQVDLPTWYTSSNARYKSGKGAVKAKFGHIGPNGLGFKIVDIHNSTIGQVKFWTEQETDWAQTLATGVADGKKFYNAFRETGTRCNVGDHEFSGSEYY